MAASKFLLVLGSYGGGILGFEILVDDEVKCSRIFAEQAHTGCVRSLVASQRLLVSGSSDETIKIFNLESKQNVSTLSLEGRGVVDLSLYDLEAKQPESPAKKRKTTDRTPAILQSCTAHGEVSLWRTTSWQETFTTKFRQRNAAGKVMRNGPDIAECAVNPSTPILSLVTYLNGSVLLWNLEKKLQLASLHGFVKSFYGANDRVFSSTWSMSGEYVFMLSSKKCTVAKLSSGHTQIIKAEEGSYRYSTMTASLDCVFLGTSSGKIEIYRVADINPEEEEASGEASTLSIEKWMEFSHPDKTRVKLLRAIQTESGLKILISVDCEGVVTLWKLARQEDECECLHSFETSLQITSLATTAARLADL